MTYVEVKKMLIHTNSMDERCGPCIALYPAINLASSWIFWSIKSKKRVRRGVYKPCKTTDLVISAMNALSGVGKIAMGLKAERTGKEGSPHANEAGRLSVKANEEDKRHRRQP